MDFDVITIFPEFFHSCLECGILRVARQKKIINIGFTNPRDFTGDGFVDDYQFGGGAGMVMKPEPLVKAVKKVKRPDSRIINLTPKGKPLNQGTVTDLATASHIVLICGRYKGIDARVEEILEPVNISAGDYILAGGEIAALALIESVARLLPGVLGNKDSAATDSLQDGNLLEPPVFTRPSQFDRREVPALLRNGNHKAIADWRKKEALRLTLEKRPDLLSGRTYTKKDLAILLEVLNEKELCV